MRSHWSIVRTRGAALAKSGPVFPAKRYASQVGPMDSCHRTAALAPLQHRTKSGFALLGSIRCFFSWLAHRMERKTGSTFPSDALAGTPQRGRSLLGGEGLRSQLLGRDLRLDRSRGREGEALRQRHAEVAV